MGRPPKIRYELRERESDLLYDLYDHRYMAREQAVDMYYPSNASAKHAISQMKKSGWLVVQKLHSGRTLHGRPLGRRTGRAVAEIDRYLGQGQEIYAIGEAGIAVLRAQGRLEKAVGYGKNEKQKHLAFMPHSLGAVEVWRMLETAAGHEPETGMTLQAWYGPRSLEKKIKEFRSRANAGTERAVLPDAFFKLRDGVRNGAFFVEVDLGTERNSAFSPKLGKYATWSKESFEQNGQRWMTYEFDPPMPRFPAVLVVTSDESRLGTIESFIERADPGGVRYYLSTFTRLMALNPLRDPVWVRNNRSFTLADLLDDPTDR